MPHKSDIPLHVREFSKHANSYESYALIQKDVAKQLCSRITTNSLDILDLGCGSGAVYHNLCSQIHTFVGVELSSSMCALHPKAGHITLFEKSFDDEQLYKTFSKHYFDYVVSSSALQWSQDRKKIYANIKELTHSCIFAIFTDKTFSHLHSFCELSSVLPSKQTLQKEIEEVFVQHKKSYTTLPYKLYFNSLKQMFEYIKKSGVSGGEKRLSYQMAKNLYQNYDRDFLEFEVLLIEVYEEA